jgi:hypothetical protein
MAKKKLVPLLFIFVGIVFLMGAVISWLDNLTASEPVGVGKWIFDIFVTLIGAGASVKGWLDLFKKDNGKGGQTQNNIGDQNTNIQGQTVNVYPPAPKELESHNTIGFIPPAKVVTYVHRGKIEEDVRTFLKNGGTGAIVGLHAPGGLGKTELAKHTSEEMKDQFEGILWVDVGEKNPGQVVGDMLMKCGVTLPPGTSEEQQKNELHHALQGHR